MFGSLGAPEIAIIGVIVVLLFGVGKLSGLGKDLGSSVKEFRKAVKDDDDKKQEAQPMASQQYQQPAPPQQQYIPPATQSQYTPPAQGQPSQQADQNKNIF
jgi:sec-independent protein translocase protein TatA